MEQMTLDGLIRAAADRPTESVLKQLLKALHAPEGISASSITEKLEEIWLSWSNDDEDLAPEQASFLIELAAASLAHTPAFRALFFDAIRAQLPPYLNRTVFLRAMGVGEEGGALNEVARRYFKLLALKSGTYVFRNNSWGIAGTPDSTTGSVPVTACTGRGTSVAVPMEQLLHESAMLGPGLETNRIIDSAKAARLGAVEFRNMVKRKALCPVSEGQMRAMALATAGKTMTPEAFEAWWTATAAARPAGRHSSTGRSLAEIELLLDKEAAEKQDAPYSAEDTAALTAFFTNLKRETAVREVVALAKVITKIVPRTPEDALPGMLSPLRAKAPFWPEDPMATPLESFAVWGNIPAKNLEGLAKATVLVFDADYLISCAMRLPLKSLNAVCAAIPQEILHDALLRTTINSSDMLLWIWKNRKKLTPEIVRHISAPNLVKVLSQEKLPREWGAAQRELKLCLLEKADLHKQLILSSNDDVQEITQALLGALFLNPGERQSLLVKLSFQSDALRAHLEGGAGQQVLNAGLSAKDKKIDVPESNEPNFTSILSHQRLLKELDDLINIHQPENREALKVARAHGDFRENAEYDAAKERRNFLSRRRAELEENLANVQPVSFKDVKAGEYAELGTTVTLTAADGAETVYHLLGAWDGNPEKNYLSYRTRLGQAIFRRKVGDQVELPNGEKVTLSAIADLPAEVLAEME